MYKNWLLVIYLIALTATAQKSKNIQISTYPDIEYQVIDGFGASDAWRAQFVGKNWPLPKKNRIADLLFSQQDDDEGNPKGIGLSIWRFYLSFFIPSFNKILYR